MSVNLEPTKNTAPKFERVWHLAKPKNFDSQHLDQFAELMIKQFPVYQLGFEFDDLERIIFTVRRKDRKATGNQVNNVRRHWLALIQGWRVRDKDFKR